MTGNQLAYLQLQADKNNRATQNQETKRHNFVVERLTRRANKEIGRHNLVTESNQQAETAAGIRRAGIAADASRYAADASANASKYAADSAAAASRYSADRNAQTQLTLATINKAIQAAHDAVNKAMNDDKINKDKQVALAKNASDQFIKQLDRELKRYEIDEANKVKYQELQQKLAQDIQKGGTYYHQTLSEILALFGFAKAEINQMLKKLK